MTDWCKGTLLHELAINLKLSKTNDITLIFQDTISQFYRLMPR